MKNVKEEQSARSACCPPQECECNHEDPCGCGDECKCTCDDAPSADAKYNEMLDRYQRCLAEFDNYRKRTAKELAARYDDGIRAACEKLLPIIDNFDRAMSASEDKETPFYQGISMIARQFGDALTDMGIKEIETNPGDPFDANLHHAVAHGEDENFGTNEVAAVLQKGYVHKERVLRYAMVKVAN